MKHSKLIWYLVLRLQTPSSQDPGEESSDRTESKTLSWCPTEKYLWHCSEGEVVCGVLTHKQEHRASLLPTKVRVRKNEILAGYVYKNALAF